MSDGKGYLLPAEMPETFRCYQVYVPDDPFFWAAFWGSLEQLTKWVAWERTADKRGADAATVWKTAFLMSRDASEEGCPVATMLRQDPENCQILQQSSDGGETWDDIADFSVCAPYAPEPIYTEQNGAGETASVQQIKDILFYFLTVADRINDELILGTPLDDITTLMGTAVLEETGMVINQSIYVLITAMDDHTPAENLTALDPANWVDFLDDLVCQSGFQDKLTVPSSVWIRDWSQELFDFLSAASEWLFFACSAMARGIGAGAGEKLLQAGWQVDGGGSGFGAITPECYAPGSYVKEYNFREERGEISLPDASQGSAMTWVAGKGWMGERDLIGNQTHYVRVASIMVPFGGQEVTVDRVDFYCWYEPGITTFDNCGNRWRDYYPFEPWIHSNPLAMTLDMPNDGTERQVVSEDEGELYGVMCAAATRRTGQNDPQKVYISSVRVEFTVS